jgi:hypothetical protein
MRGFCYYPVFKFDHSTSIDLWIGTFTNVVMGYASVRWFEKGQKISTDALNKLTKTVTTDLLESLKNLGKRKPGQGKLQEQITQSLENSPLAESRSLLDREAVE